MDKKKGYSLEHPELNNKTEAYTGNQYTIYDNGTYFSNAKDDQGMPFSSSKNGPFDSDHQSGHFQPRSKGDYSMDRSLKTRSQKRRCVMIGIIVTAILIVAIVAAVLALTFSSDSDKKEVEMVEVSEDSILKGEVTLSSKNWTDAYNDKNSTEYITTANEIIEMMDKQLQNSVLSSVYVQTTVDNIRQGSVIAECTWFMTLTKTLAKNESPDPPSFDFNVDLDLFKNTIKQIPDVADITASDMTKCVPDPCKNKGTCKSEGNTFVCTCQPGYSGATCEKELNECDSNPCLNGASCAGSYKGYTCSCEDGYTGKNCEKWAYKCSSQSCYNGGTCFDFLNGFACLCFPEWTGTQCELRVTTTVSTQLTTTTVEIPHTSTTTTTTTEELNECDSNPCLNGASCVGNNTGYTCSCKDGYTGKNCEKVEYKCSSQPCYNGGTCFDYLNGFYCLCFPEWTGTQCELRVTTTVSTQITTTTVEIPHTSTTTTTTTEGVTTTVSTQLTTTTVEIPHTSTTTTTTTEVTNACDSQPCFNGGMCFDFSNTFYCECTPAWLGDRCEKRKVTEGPSISTTKEGSSTKQTTTSQDKPYTGPTTTTDVHKTTTTTTTTTTTKSPCVPGVRYDYEIEGAILWPFEDDLQMSNTSGYKAMENTVLESLTDATKDYGLSVCNIYLQKFYPVNPLPNSPEDTEKHIGFTVVVSMLSILYEMEIQLTFNAFLPDHFYFISMRALLSTTKYQTTPLTTYPPETCSSSSPKMIYSFNLTYSELFTNDLYDSKSDAFTSLNKTLSGAFMEQAKYDSKDYWVCNISLIRCVKTYSVSGSGEIHISAEVQIHVPVNTLNIVTSAYYFSQAVLQSRKMFLIRYNILFDPSTETTTKSNMRTTTTSTTTSGPKTTDCPFWCDVGTNCISLEQLCDGYMDCFDFSDELSCATMTTATTTLETTTVDTTLASSTSGTNTDGSTKTTTLPTTIPSV